MNSAAQLLTTLAQSPIFQDYQRAFSEATGLPLNLRGQETWQPALRRTAKENPFCAFIAAQSSTCAACLRMQEGLCHSAAGGGSSAVCEFGLTEVAVAVRQGSEIVGYLVSGQVLRREVRRADIQRVLAKLETLGVAADPVQVEASYRQSRVASASFLESVTRLLSIFAEHLSMVSNQVALQQTHAEPALVTKAKEFVATHYEEEIALSQAAKAVHASTFHLCKVFRKATGLCFTEYVSRVRVEKAKELLLHPNLRVSEIAFQVGFQSLTHFNRVFRKLVGESPTEFRSSVPLALAA